MKTMKSKILILLCGLWTSLANAQHQDCVLWYTKLANNWNKALSVIKVKGSERDKVIFYTSLYHSMIDPRCASDIDGRYWGADKKIHQSEDFIYRTVFSGWDVFRSQFPFTL